MDNGVIRVGDRTEVYYRRWKVGMWLALGLFFVAAGVSLVAPPLLDTAQLGFAKGWFLVGLGLLLVVVGGYIAWTFARELPCEKPLVVLSPAGFVIRGGKLGFVPWSDVSAIKSVSAEGGAYVVILLRGEAEALVGQAGVRRWAASLNASGLPAVSFHTAGLAMGVEELAQLFQAYLDAHRSRGA